MDRSGSELFGQFSYDEKLTYEELMAHEDALVADLESLLKCSGASHLDFTPAGDMLRFQCSMEEHDLESFRLLTARMCSFMPEGVHGRLICLDKTFRPETAFYFFWLDRRGWQEAARKLPLEAPAGLKVWPPQKYERDGTSGASS